MGNDWQNFWNNYLPDKYGHEEVESPADLFRQAARTVNKEPMSPEIFSRQVQDIVTHLKLCPEDHLVDFCCCNGLIGHELAPLVRHFTGIDFAERPIAAARKFKSRENMTYLLGDVMSPLPSLLGRDVFPNKYLMTGSLAYFEPEGLATILNNLREHMGKRLFWFLLTDVPDIRLKWNFYNTPERMARHLENEKKPGNTNDGLGRWWSRQEVEKICSRHDLGLKFINQANHVTNYRMDVLITTPPQIKRPEHP